ncbi:UNVERIFIED_CONTAM: uncharacterized protein DUF2508 [Acetivibrio alkalicellulosi]
MGLNTEKNQDVKINKNNILTKLFNKLSLLVDNPINIEGETNDEENLIECIKSARNDWIKASSEFEYAVDSDIVDYYTYKIKAYEVRYQYLIKLAKRKGITLEYIKNL